MCGGLHLCRCASEDHASIGDAVDAYVEEGAAAERRVEEPAFGVKLRSEAEVALELTRLTDGA